MVITETNVRVSRVPHSREFRTTVKSGRARVRLLSVSSMFIKEEYRFPPRSAKAI